MVDLKGILTFAGGVHPSEMKELSEDCPIQPGPKPKQLFVHLSQHLGAPCKAVVAKKDTVIQGQLLADSEAFVSAPIHSPIAGTVKDIALSSHPVLGRSMSVVIDANEETDITLPDMSAFTADFDETQYDPSHIITLVGKAGVVGMGGAGFPSKVKMSPNPQMPLDTLIINGCECEPYITCDYRMMIEWTNQILAGVKLIKRASKVDRVFIAIEDNKPKAIECFKKAVKEHKNCEDIEVSVVKTKYPQGGEKQLIRSILKKDIPVGGIPPMIGVLVCNVATAAAVADAVVLEKPLTHRAVTVSGGGINNRGNFYCAIGTTVQELLDFCGGINEKAVRIIMGGPMMGFAIADLSTPITKTSGAITVLTKKEVGNAKYQQRQTACIRCGRCVSVCPANLNPTKIAHCVKNDMIDAAKDYYMLSCIECGCCSYVCPANIELTGYIKTGKILEARRKKLMPQ